MKKFTMFFAVILTVLLISTPAFAGNNTVGDNSDYNNQTKGKDSPIILGDSYDVHDNLVDIHDNTVNVTGDVVGGDKTINNNSTHDSHDTYDSHDTIDNSVDKSKTDNSILKNANLKDSQNGLLNQKGMVNQAGLANQAGMGNQQGLLNIKGSGNQTGLINVKGGYKNHSGNSHNSGIIEQSKNNSGIIVNQQQNGGKGGGYPYPITTGSEPNGEVDPGQGGGGHHNNTVNASIDNSTCIIEDKREFAPGPAPVIASFADYVGSETPGYTYSTIEEMLTFGNIFTESQINSMAGDRGIRNAEVDVTMMDSNMARQKPTLHPTAKEKTITFYYKAVVPSPIRRGAFITVAMKSVKGISVETLGKTGKAALAVGANSVFLTAQGMDITQSQHSIAIGPGISFSSIGGNEQQRGRTGGGGINYSYGVFGKNYKPYLRSMALYVEDEDHRYVPKGEKVK